MKYDDSSYPIYRFHRILPDTPVSDYEQLISTNQEVLIGTKHPEDSLKHIVEWLKKYPNVLLTLDDFVDLQYSLRERKKIAKEQGRPAITAIAGETDTDKTLRLAGALHGVQRLGISVKYAESYEALRPLSQLKWLFLGFTLKPLSIGFIENIPELQKIKLTGRPKNIEVLRGLSHLDQLVLTVFKGSVDFLAGHPSLRSLWIEATGKVDLSILSMLPALVDLSIIQRGPSLIAGGQALDGLRGLKTLCLKNLKNLENLDFLNNMSDLRYLHLEGCQSIASLKPLTKLPNLRAVVLTKVRPVDQDMMCIVECPALEEIYSNGGSIPDDRTDHFNAAFRGRILYMNGWYRGSNFRHVGLPAIHENPGQFPEFEFYRSHFHENMPSGYPGY